MTSDDPRMLADEMLGKLARDLRALGYDVEYVRDAHDDEVLARALGTGRLLLTRDAQLAGRAGDRGVLVESLDPVEQVGEVVRRLGLRPTRERFLSRCMACNGVLEPADADDAVPDSVRGQPTWRCVACGKVYWRGTHADDMLERLGGYFEDAG